MLIGLLNEAMDCQEKIVSFEKSVVDPHYIYLYAQDGWDGEKPNLVTIKEYPNGILMKEIAHNMLIWLVSNDVVLTIDKNNVGETTISFYKQPDYRDEVKEVGFNLAVIAAANKVYIRLKREGL